MKNHVRLCIFFATCFFIPIAQSQDITNDTVCIMGNTPFMYNVTTNDLACQNPSQCHTMLIEQSTCFALDINGNLSFIGNIPDCCGDYVLHYRIMGLPIIGTIYITVKCPKPDCGLVELEPTGGTTGGGVGGKITFNACENSTATYYFNHTIGNTYTWMVTGGSYTVIDSGMIDVVWGSSGSGMITLTVTNGTNVQTYMYCVNILNGPTAAFTTLSTTVCLKSPVSFINNSIGGTSFFWTFGDGGTSGAFSPTHIYMTPGTFTVTLYVMQTNYDPMGNPLCCCTDSVSLDIIVDELEGPDILWISTLCEGDSSCYWTTATGCNYTWTVLDANNVPVTFTGQGNDTICLQWGQGPHGIITLQLSNCTGNYCLQPVSVVVPIIDANAIITGPTKVCANSSATYTLPKWMSVNYDWTVMGGTIVSADSTSNTVTILWGNGPMGMIMVDYFSKFLKNLPGHEEGDCHGMSILKVNILPEYHLLPPPATACVGDMSFFTTDMTAVNGFTWNITPLITPFPIVGPNNITVTWPSSGFYTVSVYPNAPNPFCNDTLYATVHVLQVPPPDSIVGEIVICPGSTFTYTGYGSTPGVGFMWTVTGGTPSTFTGNPISVTWNASGPYILSLRQFQINAPGCISAPITLTVTKKMINGPLLITGPNGCINDVDTYTLSPAQPSGTTFLWSVNLPSTGSVIMGQGTNSADIQWNNTPATVTITCDVTVCGVTTPVTKIITLTAPIQPVITQIGILCPSVSATLDAGPGFTSYLWSNAMTTQTISISGPGVYTVTTTDANWCTAIDSYEAFNVPGPVADITTPDPLVLCIMPVGQTTVTLYALTNPNYTYQWYCNFLPAGTGNPLVHTNNNMAGTFSYFVIVMDVLTGCTKQSNTITVTQQLCMPGGGGGCNPQAYTLAITDMNNTPLCNDVTFTVNNVNATPSFWNFGDPGGNTYSGPISNPTHTYSKAGYFLATLSATVPNTTPPPTTCTVYATTQVVVPVAAEFSCTNMCRTYTFTDFSTYVLGESIVNYFWSFGDLGTMNGPNPIVNHTYAVGGTYTVTLTVTTANGCQSTFSKMVTAPPDPNANFLMAPNPACVGDAVVFTPASTTGIVSFLWTFGDASTNGSSNPSHAYLTGATFPVSLTVTDINGCTAISNSSILIHPTPIVAPIMVSDSIICQGDTATLTADPGFASYLWNTGATTQIIQVTLTGTYSVTITDVNGCTAVPDSVVITVITVPPATISGSHYICGNGCITLQANTGYNFMYQWYDELFNALPGETTASLTICANTFQDTVIVEITDANGCVAVSAPWAIALAVAPPVAIVVLSGDTCAGMPNVLSVSPILSYCQYFWSTGATGTGIIVSQAGTYTVLAVDTTTGCSSSASIVIHPLPNLCLVPVGCYTMCKNDTLCGPSGLSMYQWNKNGVPIPGATMMWYVVTMNGSYSLTGTTSFGCEATSDSLIIMVIECCRDTSTEVTADPIPSTGDSCCWSLSYINYLSAASAIQIMTADADIMVDLSSVDPLLSVYGTTSNSVTLTNAIAGDSIPMDTLLDFIDICFKNITSSPIELIIQWFDSTFHVICKDTLYLECTPEPPCLYLASDSIWCDLDIVVYQMELCNPAYNPYPISFVAISSFSPSGIVLSPSQLNLGTPLLPGQCSTFIFTLSGGNFANQQFCYNLTGHETNPAVDTAALCCSLDTMYCIQIPGCSPCDSVYVADVIRVETETDSCCYAITLVNYYDSLLIDGIDVCILTSGSTMTLDNLLGSYWWTEALTPTTASLNYSNPENPDNPFIPIGPILLPTICIQNGELPVTKVEIKWMHGDMVVCRDTIELNCHDCGYFDPVIHCDESGNWVVEGSIFNNTPYTIGSAYFSFETTVYASYNQTIPTGVLAPGASYGPISFTIGAPGNAGDTICMFITLHTLDHTEDHVNCCAFKVLFVLPDCGDVEEPCACNPAFYQEVDKGITCDFSLGGNTVIFSPTGNLNPDCDRVVWIFQFDNVPVTTFGNESVTYVFPGPGEYEVCMIVHRSTPTEECKLKIQKQVTIFPPGAPPGLYPNPVGDQMYLQLRQSHPSIRVELFDLQGRILLDITTHGQAGEIISLPVDSFAEGLYTARITSANNQWIRRFIKIE